MVNYEGGSKREKKEGKQAERPPVEPQVQFMCFSADGTRMATIDVRPDVDKPDSCFHSNLRFWERRPSGLNYTEGTPLFTPQLDYDRPHR